MSHATSIALEAPVPVGNLIRLASGAWRAVQLAPAVAARAAPRRAPGSHKKPGVMRNAGLAKDKRHSPEA